MRKLSFILVMLYWLAWPMSLAAQEVSPAQEVSRVSEVSRAQAPSTMSETSVAPASQYVKTWMEAGKKDAAYASLSALYSRALAPNYEVRAAYSFQYDKNFLNGNMAHHAFMLQSQTHLSQHFSVLHKLLLHDMSAWRLREYAASLSFKYEKAWFSGEVGMMHRILQDLAWEEKTSSNRYLHEPFGLLYDVRFQFVPRNDQRPWSLAYGIANFDEFHWDRGYTPQFSLLFDWCFSAQHQLFAQWAYTPAGTFNQVTSPYKSFLKLGWICYLK